MITTFSTTPAAGTLGYMAAIDRKGSSRAAICQTGKHQTRAAAVRDCLERIAMMRVRVKPSDTITTTEWTASGDGSWQCELMKLLERSVTVSIEAARQGQLCRVG